MIQAKGSYWLSQSQAAILAEQARSSSLGNACLKREYLLWKKEQRHAALEAKRHKNEAAWLERFRSAYELTANQLDRATGEIVWPEPLQAARYHELRQRLDELFQRARNDPPSASKSEIASAAERLIRDLQRNQSTISKTEYLAAQKFLCGLKYEPQFRPQVN